MSAPVLPIGREDGYHLVDSGRVTFVPLSKPSPFLFAAILPEPATAEQAARTAQAMILLFPQRFRATSRAVGAEIEKAIDQPEGDE